MASDPLTLFENGIVAAADAAAAVVALTNRSAQNLVPWSAFIPSLVPVVTYVIPTCVPRVGGYTILLTLSAWAEQDAGQLLHEMITAFAQPLLFATGCDAVLLEEIRREIPSEDEDDPSRADADLTFWFTP